MSPRQRQRGVATPGGLVADFLSVFVAVSTLALSAWATVPVAVGDVSATVVRSASMAPLIQPGDVVLTAAPAPGDLKPGIVVRFGDPDDPRRDLLHRVVRVEADGEVTTKGDANPAPDPHTITPGDVEGVGRILVPLVGRPAQLLRTGNTIGFVGWLLVTAIAIGRVGRRWPVVFAASGASSRNRRPRRVTALSLIVATLLIASAPSAAAALTAHTSTSASYAALRLTAPTDVQATPACQGATAGVELDWTTAEPGEGISYEIERRPLLDPTWQSAGSVNEPVYFDEPPALNVAQEYRVRSIAGAWISDWSDVTDQVAPPVTC